MKIQKYLPEQYYRKLQLKSCVIAALKKQDTSKALDLLRQLNANMGQFQHLKRIRKRSNQNEEVDLLVCGLEDVGERERLVNGLGGFVVRTWEQELPLSNPCTKEQYLEWSKVWPINFIEQEVYKETKHSKQEQQFLQQISALDLRSLTLFSDKQQMLQVKTIEQPCKVGSIDHTIMRLLQEWPNSKQFNNLPNAYYLTKLRLFCNAPICQMCAMALVHSRLERIYFPFQLEIALVGEILCCSKLNHRVKIFQVSKNPQNK